MGSSYQEMSALRFHSFFAKTIQMAKLAEDGAAEDRQTFQIQGKVW